MFVMNLEKKTAVNWFVAQRVLGREKGRGLKLIAHRMFEVIYF